MYLKSHIPTEVNKLHVEDHLLSCLLLLPEVTQKGPIFFYVFFKLWLMARGLCFQNHSCNSLCCRKIQCLLEPISFITESLPGEVVIHQSPWPLLLELPVLGQQWITSFGHLSKLEGLDQPQLVSCRLLEWCAHIGWKNIQASKNIHHFIIQISMNHLWIFCISSSSMHSGEVHTSESISMMTPFSAVKWLCALLISDTAWPTAFMKCWKSSDNWSIPFLNNFGRFLIFFFSLTSKDFGHSSMLL